MPAIVTNNYRIFNEENFKRTVLTVPIYVFIGKETSFTDDNNPPMPLDTDLEKTQIFNDLLAVKRVSYLDIQTVIPRYNWKTNEIFDEYENDVNMIDSLSPITNSFRKFYVLTDDLNVYKCISNNNRADSTVKPTGTGINSFETADGYIWKFMYSLKAVDVLNFLTEDWMPVYHLKTNDGSNQWQVQTQAVDGSIEHIIVNNGGSDYSPSNPPVVNITGNGSGATAVAEVNQAGNIETVKMTNIGEGYTNATITLTNTQGGTGASFKTVYSPIGGHGFNAKKELGGFNSMIKLTINGDEGGAFPETQYRQIGLIEIPFDNDLGAKIYTNDNILFEVGDQVTGGTSGATGFIRYIDIDRNYIYIESTTGQFLQSENITNNGNSVTIDDLESNVNIPLTSLVAGEAGLELRKGNIIYHANREPITRNADQREDFRFVISF